jgi:flagellum-specific peptidoglycan hydrolase FlgJ
MLSIQDQFIEALVANGFSIAKKNNLPLETMVACGVEESGYGTSDIFTLF